MMLTFKGWAALIAVVGGLIAGAFGLVALRADPAEMPQAVAVRTGDDPVTRAALAPLPDQPRASVYTPSASSPTGADMAQVARQEIEYDRARRAVSSTLR